MSKTTSVTMLLHTTTKIAHFHTNGYGDRTNKPFMYNEKNYTFVTKKKKGFYINMDRRRKTELDDEDHELRTTKKLFSTSIMCTHVFELSAAFFQRMHM